jgi:hypothetical protein
MSATPKPYPLAAELSGRVDDGKPVLNLRPGQAPPKPYPVWSWQKWRKWKAETRAMFDYDDTPEPEE